MENKKRNVIIFVILCVLLIVVGVLIYMDIFSKTISDNLIIGNHNGSLDEEITDEKENDIFSDVNTEDSNYDNELVNDNNKNSSNNELSNDINNYSEKDVVDYFENIQSEVDNSSSFKEKFKEYFITIVDFIFYDKEIKGYTFDDLSGTAKAKIIAIALKLDSKIEEYVPNYKESISSTTGKVYTDIKEKLVTSYFDISITVCKNNEDECNMVKEIFSDVKDYCKIGWDFIKGLFKRGTSKIKDWYEIYSGK